MVRKKIKKISGGFFTSLIVFLLCACPAPGGNPPEYGEMNFIYYPEDTVIFHDTFGLFSTNIQMIRPDQPIGSFEMILNYDGSLMQYESVYCPGGVVNIQSSPGTLKVSGSNLDIPPGEDLFLLTWKALSTGITDISLEAVNLVTTADQEVSIPGIITSRVKILKELGTLSLKGPDYIEIGSEFTKTLVIDTEGKNITEYNLDILFDPDKISLNIDLGILGVLPGNDGFMTTIVAFKDRLNIYGKRTSGIGPGENLEMLLSYWIASNPGRSTFSVVVNKMVTSDNIYLKPDIRGGAISIYSQNNKPIVDIWLEPGTLTLPTETGFMTSIMLNTEGYVLAAYGIDIYYDPDLLELDLSMGSGNGLETGEDGFLTASNTLEPGEVRIAGFDLTGAPPNPQLELIKIYWKTKEISGSSEITLDIKQLADTRSRDIERVRVTNCSVTVTE